MATVLIAIPLAVPSFVGALTLLGATGADGILSTISSWLGGGIIRYPSGFWAAWVGANSHLGAPGAFGRHPGHAFTESHSGGCCPGSGGGSDQGVRTVTLPQLRPALTAAGCWWGFTPFRTLGRYLCCAMTLLPAPFSWNTRSGGSAPGTGAGRGFGGTGRDRGLAGKEHPGPGGLVHSKATANRFGGCSWGRLASCWGGLFGRPGHPLPDPSGDGAGGLDTAGHDLRRLGHRPLGGDGPLDLGGFGPPRWWRRRWSPRWPWSPPATATAGRV